MMNTSDSAMNWRRQLATALRQRPWVMKPLLRAYRWTRPKWTLGVVGIVFNDRREVLLVEHVLHPHHPWGLPGGWVDAREAPIVSVARELHEEVALTVEVGPLIQVEQIAEIQHLDFAFLCYAPPPYAITALSPELLDFGWHPVDSLPHIDPFHHRSILSAYEQISRE